MDEATRRQFCEQNFSERMDRVMRAIQAQKQQGQAFTDGLTQLEHKLDRLEQKVDKIVRIVEEQHKAARAKAQSVAKLIDTLKNQARD